MRWRNSLSPWTARFFSPAKPPTSKARPAPWQARLPAGSAPPAKFLRPKVHSKNSFFTVPKIYCRALSTRSGLPPDAGRRVRLDMRFGDHILMGVSIMPQGDKSKYTNKQKRKAEHIEE